MPDPVDVDHLLDVAVAALGGSPREGQRRMAREVADAVEKGEHLLVQAGTGTGKSLGYLVPSVRHAVLADERVVVSTATLALQRQVMTRDLPLVADALAPELPRPPRIALLKGWHNYVCVHKTAGGYPPDDQGMLFDLGDRGAAEHPSTTDPADGEDGGRESLGAQVVRLRAWAEETESGDRDDLVPGVTDRAWRQVSVTSLECLGQRCPLLEECFPERARAAARAADVVVTNHAMLGVAASGSPHVLPEHQVLVVDEAHELADRVTAQSTAELSVGSVEHAGRMARRHGGVATTELDSAATALGAALIHLPEGRFTQGLPEGTRQAVAMVRDAARGLLSALRPEKPAAGEAAAPADSGLKIASSAVLALFEVAERMAADADDQRYTVLWCSRAERDGATRLYAAPLAVNGLIRTHLLAGRASVLTSATLSLGGEFRSMARSIGLEGAGEAAAATAMPPGTAEVSTRRTNPGRAGSSFGASPSTVAGMPMVNQAMSVTCRGSSGNGTVVTATTSASRIEYTVLDRNSVATRSMLAMTRRPSATTCGSVAKSLSSSTIRATARAAGLPLPIATPTSASLRARTSFTPSPVIATVCPRAVSARTSARFCSGATRPSTTARSAASASASCSSGSSRASSTAPAGSPT